MASKITNLIELISRHHGINDKEKLTEIVQKEFGLVKDRKIYYCDEFAIRFSESKNGNFANTVASLSKVQKYDDRPFVVCLVTPDNNRIMLANSTFLRKISHSSQNLLINNIRGSFNGSDIVSVYEEIDNSADNIERLFAIHEPIGFQGNLQRLVDATASIQPSGSPLEITSAMKAQILDAPSRAESFVISVDFKTLKSELDSIVKKFEKEILITSLIDNVKVRGSVIEYLVAGEDAQLKAKIIEQLVAKSRSIPDFMSDNELGDFSRRFDDYHTETDVKTKIMVLNSNPKAYNVDKMLKFLSGDKSVFMFYFIGIEKDNTSPITALASMFQNDILDGTRVIKHWAGRDSRGVTQIEGRAIATVIRSGSNEMVKSNSTKFLEGIIEGKKD